MTLRRAGQLAAAAVALLAAAGVARTAGRGATERAQEPDPAHVAAAVVMMTDFPAESVGHAVAIRQAYAPAVGLAVDIPIRHTSLADARERRDVVRSMARDGDRYFMAEQRQLVFRVPAPARRARYAESARAADTDSEPHPPQPWRALASKAGPAASAPATPWTDARSVFLRYAALLAWLVGSGLGTPPGEDLFLAGAGALVSSGVLAWWPMLLLAVVGVVTSDLMLFLGGRAVGAPIARRPRLASHGVVRRLDRAIGRWGRAAVVVARFTPGLRALVFISAGARGMRPVSFALTDICAAIVWVPLMMTVGAWALGSLVAAAPVSLGPWV